MAKYYVSLLKTYTLTITPPPSPAIITHTHTPLILLLFNCREKRKLIIPPHLGYGSRAIENVIPGEY